MTGSKSPTGTLGPKTRSWLTILAAFFSGMGAGSDPVQGAILHLLSTL